MPLATSLIRYEDLNEQWVGAGHLKVGDKIQKADGGFGVVEYVNTVQQTRTMYNLEVKEAHTFFVGTQGWLVHNTSCRWKVGDGIYAPTAKGTEPAWSTVRGRFWKNAASQPGASEKYGADNVTRMQKGLAPQRFNADKGGVESMELSHEPIPMRDGGRNVVSRWPQDHGSVDPYRRPGY